MDPHLFLADLERKPELLDALADAIDDGWPAWPAWPDRLSVPTRGNIVIIGMGSSLYAAQVAAQRLRVNGFSAVAESASVDATLPLGSRDVAVGISASGASAETLRLFETCAGAKRTAMSNRAGSAITTSADHTVDLLAGDEAGGVACTSFTHTLIALLSLEQHLSGSDLQLATRTRTAAAATRAVIDRRDEWLPHAIDLLAGPHGTWLLAPAERLSSAMQGALMLREGPRRAAVGCETGDWSHVDVYLTKSLDYRALVFPGSRWDGEAARWLAERGSTIVAVGGAFPGAALTVRHPGDDDALVRLLVETTVPELIAASLWIAD
jgi:glutamine---fructose-6-phosphate transaminase (isomerizing)